MDSGCQAAFDNLKRLCSSAPILAYADYGKPFQLCTDASISGLGAVLYQRQDDGTHHVIAYASCTLSKADGTYDAHKHEFLVLKWSISEQFHEYLYGGQFEVFTDNNPLTYVLTTPKLDATGWWWVADLDLSQIKWEDDESITILIEDTIRAIIGIGSTEDRTILEAYSSSIQIKNMSPTLYTKKPTEEEMVTGCVWMEMQAPAKNVT